MSGSSSLQHDDGTNSGRSSHRGRVDVAYNAEHTRAVLASATMVLQSTSSRLRDIASNPQLSPDRSNLQARNLQSSVASRQQTPRSSYRGDASAYTNADSDTPLSASAVAAVALAKSRLVLSDLKQAEEAPPPLVDADISQATPAAVASPKFHEVWNGNLQARVSHNLFCSRLSELSIFLHTPPPPRV